MMHFKTCKLLIAIWTTLALVAPAFAEGVDELKLRGEYVLASPDYELAIWKQVIDQYAAQGNNFICWWGSSFFRSKKYPNAFYYKDHKGKLLSHDDVHALIQYCRAKNIKFYMAVGGFSWLTVDTLAEVYPETRAVEAGGMCPNNPKAHEINIGWVEELIQTFPEVDGVMIEPRDENGICHCPVCQTKIDEYGSQKYGQGELEFIRELSERLWKINPQYEIMTCIGYGEHKTHVNDVAFYNGLRALSDPRYIWLEVRGNWTLPGPDGKPQPLRDLSPRVVTWFQPEFHTAEELAAWVRRAAREGLEGVCLGRQAGEWGSCFLIRHQNPYIGHSFRKDLALMTFSTLAQHASMSEEEYRKSIAQAFFGPEGGPQHYDGLAYLDELLLRIIKHCGPAGSYFASDPKVFLDLLRKTAHVDKLTSVTADEWHEIYKHGRAVQLPALLEGERLRSLEALAKSVHAKISQRNTEKFNLVQEELNYLNDLLCLGKDKTSLLDTVFSEAAARVPPFTSAIMATSESGPAYSADLLFDGKPSTNWLCANGVPLPQSITIELPAFKTIEQVKLTQSSERLDYNTRNYRIEGSRDGSQFTSWVKGELPLEKGASQVHDFKDEHRARFLRITIDSIYPDAAFSSPALAEIEITADHKPLQKLY